MKAISSNCRRINESLTYVLTLKVIYFDKAGVDMLVLNNESLFGRIEEKELSKLQTQTSIALNPTEQLSRA